MATLTGQKISNSYKDLLQVSNSNSGIDTTKRDVSDGEGTSSPLQLSDSIVNINGTFQLNDVTLTSNASALNNITDLTGITGLVAVSGGTAYGRTLSGTAPVSISNKNGTEGNPTISLKESGITSATYGPSSKLNISKYGIVVDAETTTQISATTFEGALTGNVSGNVVGNVQGDIDGA